MIRRDPQLHWDYFVADKRDIGYQKPVIMGFTDAPKDYYVDIDRLVVTEAHCIIAGDPVRRDAAGASCTGSADADHTPSRV